MKPKKNVTTPLLAVKPSTPINTDIDREKLIDKVLADQLRIYRESVETSRGILENVRESRKKSSTTSLSDGEEIGEAMLIANIAEVEALALQVEERLAKRTEEKSFKALQTSRGNTHFADEDLKNQFERLTEANSAQADNLERRGKIVADLSTQLAGQCDQSTPKPHPKPTPMDTSEGSAKEGSFWKKRKRSKASKPTTTDPQLPPNQQANGPGKPGPAEYYKTEDGRYGCLKCGSSYKHKFNLNRHKKYECGVQAQFECTDCLRKFKLKSHLKSHIVTKSCHNGRDNKWNGPAEYYKTEDGRYGCLKCGLSYKYMRILNRHKKYECGVQGKFQCADCLRNFKHKADLKTHIVTKSCHNRQNKNCNSPVEYYKTEDGRYGCLKCQSSYKHKFNLNRHKKYECGVQGQFECTDCLRKFKHKSDLKTHIVFNRCHNPLNIN